MNEANCSCYKKKYFIRLLYSSGFISVLKHWISCYKMNSILIAVLLSFAFHCHVSADSYNDKYDGMNIDEALSNKRLMSAYIKCVLEQGKCTPEGKELKTHISDALQSGCTKCTGPQRRGIRKVIGHLINYEPSSWQQLVDKYDPKRVYTHKYENELKSIRG